jgi:hypothetical protein
VEKVRRIFTALVLIAAAVGAFMAYQVGKVHERAHWLALENATLREQAKEITRQVEAVAAKQKEYNDAQAQINDFAVRLRSADRVRVQAEHRARIARADAESLRVYSAGLNDLYESCRTEYLNLGLEAARLAAALGALK